MLINRRIDWVKTGGLIIAILCSSATAFAHDKPIIDQITFQVEVGEEVENDRMVAIMSITAENKKSAKLANTINESMNWAVEKTRAYKTVKTSSGRYQVNPVYDKKRIDRWRGSQQLRLESSNMQALSELVGTLQDKLQVQSMQFSVSPERRRQVENGLIEQAMTAYLARAKIVQKSLGASGYTLGSLALRAVGGIRPVPRMRAESLSATSMNQQPATEGGTTRLTLQVSGSIYLQRD